MKTLTLDQLTKAANGADVSRKSYRARFVEELQKDTQLSYIVNSYARSLAEAEASFEMLYAAARIANGGEEETTEAHGMRMKYALDSLAREAFRRLSQQPGVNSFGNALIDADRVAAAEVLKMLDVLGE